MNENRQQFAENLRKLLYLKDKKSYPLIKETMELFSLSVQRKLLLIILFIILFFITKFVLFDEKYAIEIISNLTNAMNSILLPMFTIIITGFAIFQAISNEVTLLRLLKVSHKGKESKFAVFNKYFFGIGFMYLVLIIINTVLQFIFSNMSKKWSIGLFDDCFNEVLAAFLINLYLIIIINALIEMKSYIYNLFQVFITSTASIGLNTLEKMDDEKDKG